MCAESRRLENNIENVIHNEQLGGAAHPGLYKYNVLCKYKVTILVVKLRFLMRKILPEYTLGLSLWLPDDLNMHRKVSELVSGNNSVLILRSAVIPLRVGGVTCIATWMGQRLVLSTSHRFTGPLCL